MKKKCLTIILPAENSNFSEININQLIKKFSGLKINMSASADIWKSSVSPHSSIKEAPYWLRADPIHLQATHNAAYCLGSEILALTPEEAKILLADLNDFLKVDNMHLYSPTPTEWYLALFSPSQIYTHLPKDVIGKNIHSYLPTGEQAQYWRRWFTTVQMFLYQHPVNQARRDRKQAELNGLWCWGGGESLTILAESTTEKMTDQLETLLQAVKNKSMDELTLILNHYQWQITRQKWWWWF